MNVEGAGGTNNAKSQSQANAVAKFSITKADATPHINWVAIGQGFGDSHGIMWSGSSTWIKDSNVNVVYDDVEDAWELEVDGVSKGFINGTRNGTLAMTKLVKGKSFT